MPQAISMLIALSMNAPAVVSRLPVIHNIAVSKIIAPFAAVSPTWPGTALINGVSSVTLPTTFLLTVLLQKTPAQVSSSTRETPRGFDVVLVVQVYKGGIVMV